MKQSETQEKVNLIFNLCNYFQSCAVYIDLLFFQHPLTNESESAVKEDQKKASNFCIKSDSQPSSYGFDSEEHQLTKIIKTEQKVRINPPDLFWIPN